MPHQQFDANMDRVAGQRRCEEDDQAFVLARFSRLVNSFDVFNVKRTPVVESAQLVPHDVLAGNDPRAAFRPTARQRQCACLRREVRQQARKGPNHLFACITCLPPAVNSIVCRFHD